MTDSLHEIIAALEAMYDSKKFIRKADYWARCAGEAAEYLRKIAAGEYKPVVHAEWVADEFGHKCSVCGEYIGDDTYENECLTFCPNCGAPMDGKDGGHEAD